MAVELVVPTVGESITEVQIGDWLVPEGQSANKEDALVVIETDKVTVELPAPISGTVTKVLKKKGETAAVGEVIGYIDAAVKGKAPSASERSPSPKGAETSAAAAKSGDAKTATVSSKDASSAAASSNDAKSAGASGGDAKSAGASTSAEAKSTPASKNAPAPKSLASEPARVMPSAARALAQSGLSAADVEATGPGGRVLKEDVQRRIELGAKPIPAPPVLPAQYPTSSSGQPATSSPGQLATSSPGQPASSSKTASPRAASGGNREEETVPMTAMRKRIAERLVHAQNTAALLTTFNEIDMSAVMALRNEHKESFQARHGVKLGFMSFFVKAAIDGLKLVPQMNAELSGDSIVYHNYYDIGVAVGGGKGLVVPVLRNAERMSFAEVETTIGELAQRAQANKLTLEELQGGTFTISNGGIYGSLLSTPIVNPPQSGILGLHAIQDRPMAINGQVVVRPMMYVAVTYDHRLVDGREAVTFLKRIKECVENPARMLLEI